MCIKFNFSSSVMMCTLIGLCITCSNNFDIVMHILDEFFNERIADEYKCSSTTAIVKPLNLHVKQFQIYYLFFVYK